MYAVEQLPAPARASDMQGGYRNLGYILPVFPLIIVAGFWHPYFSQIPKFDSSITSAVHIDALLLFAWVPIVRILKRDTAEHMRYMIGIALVLLAAGLARTLGDWFGVNQSTSQAVCLALIDLCLISLIVFDRRRHLAARPYVVALAAYVISETGWLALGRPV